MKASGILFLAAICMLLVSCKKDSPIEDLGTATGSYRASLSVSLSSRTLELGDTLTVTATTAHRNDNITSVEFLHTLYEKFGVILELESTNVVTWSESDPNMVITDTIANNVVWKSVSRANNELNNYYLTQSNNYVITGDYDLFVVTEGNYNNSGEGLLMQLPNEAFDILKNQLAYSIAVSDFVHFFPEAGDENFTWSGSTRAGISTAGNLYLRTNLTRALLMEKGFKELKKTGKLYAAVTVKVTSDAGAVSQVANNFESIYQL